MSEWFVEVQSMIPVGELRDRMLVAKIDRMRDTAEVMLAPVMKTIKLGESVGASETFMTALPFSTFQHGEIDQFLQAMMDAGWKRGLRPKDFDPSAGELAAVNRHLEDLRKIVMGREPPGGLGPIVYPSGPYVPPPDEVSDARGSDKKW